MYAIEISKAAQKALDRIPSNIAAVIRKKILALADDPYAANNNVVRMQGMESYRLRVGDWRVIYEIIDHRMVIQVIDIKPRGGAYKQ